MYPVFLLFLILLLFIGFVVVVCVISEAAGKAADRQKGKAVVRQTDRRTVLKKKTGRCALHGII